MVEQLHEIGEVKTVEAYTLGKMCQKICVNRQFYFNLSSKMWSHVFFEHSVETFSHFCDALSTTCIDSYVLEHTHNVMTKLTLPKVNTL